MVLHATAARRALAELEGLWQGPAAEFTLLARALVGVAKAWDDAERDGQNASPIIARWLDVFDRVAEGCETADDGEGVNGGDGWSEFAVRARTPVGASPVTG